MTARRIVAGGFWGGLTGLAVVALLYLGERLAGLPFAPFDIFDWLARVLPGAVITAAIDLMVQVITRLGLGPTSTVAKLAEQAAAIGLFIAGGFALGALLTAMPRRWATKLPVLGGVAGLIFLAVAIAAEFRLGFPPAGPALSILWLALVFIGWGALLGRLAATPAGAAEPRTQPSRRRFLWLTGMGSFAVIVSAAAVKLLSGQEPAADAPPAREAAAGEKTGGPPGSSPAQEPGLDILARDATSGPAASPPWSVLEARTPQPAPGTRPELTANRDFYRIDINLRPPVVSGTGWRLEVGGLVRQGLRLSLEDLRAMPAVNQAITLSCISNVIGGDLIGTGVWTGVRLRDVLDRAELRAGVRGIAMEAADGFYEFVPIDEARDPRTLLVYAINGAPLPVEHGFPLRICIPDHFGMKQPKWLTRLEAIDREEPGYWVDRGWDEAAIVKTTAVVDTVGGRGEPAAGIVPIGGIAYAGARGISRVQVRIDDGPWTDAELRSPALSPLTWVQWRFDWRAAPGRHDVSVRAYDGGGRLQESEPAPPHPSGATGIHQVRARVREAGAEDGRNQ